MLQRVPVQRANSAHWGVAYGALFKIRACINLFQQIEFSSHMHPFGPNVNWQRLFKDDSMEILATYSPDLNQVEILWTDLEIAVQ